MQSEREIGMSRRQLHADAADDSGTDTDDETPRKLEGSEAFLIFVAVAVPSVIMIVCFSDLGYGMDFNNFVAARNTDLVGMAGVGIGFLLGCLCFILEWSNWDSAPAKTVTGGMIVSMVCGGIAMNGLKFLGAHLYMCMFLIPVLVAAVRYTCCRTVFTRHFSRAVGSSAAVTAALLVMVIIAWLYTGNWWNQDMKDRLVDRSTAIYEVVYSPMPLNYTVHCKPGQANLTMYSREDRADISCACESASTLWFLAWSCPFIALICNMVLFAFMTAITHSLDKDAMLVATDIRADVTALEQKFKIFAASLVLLLTGMYAAASIAGSSLRLSTTLMGFFGVALASLGGWTWIELKPEILAMEEHCRQTLESSGTVDKLNQVVKSDWARALFVGGLFLPIVFYIFLDRVREKLRNDDDDEEERGISYSQSLQEEMSTWDWASILSKICLLGELYFVMTIGFSKLTYIFLSWLNDFLKYQGYGLALIFFIALVTGTLLFILLPPLPGVAVYLFCGILISSKVSDMESIGFIWGVLLAIALALISKILGSMGQYAIGARLGKNLRIQALCQVDSMGSKAMKQILQRRGLDLGKVAILVGGPDWPTSVACGLLGINLGQMVLGTLPIVIVMAPTCLAGAFSTRSNPADEDDMWKTYASICMLTTAVAQPASSFMAAHAIARVIADHSDELSVEDPAHEPLKAINAEKERYSDVYRKVTRWSKLNAVLKAIIVFAAFLLVCCGFVFLSLGSTYCFRPFAVSSHIDDSYELHGLDGDVWSVVRTPYGWPVLSVFAVGVFLHLLFDRITASLANAGLLESQDEESSDSGSTADRELLTSGDE